MTLRVSILVLLIAPATLFSCGRTALDLSGLPEEDADRGGGFGGRDAAATDGIDARDAAGDTFGSGGRSVASGGATGSGGGPGTGGRVATGGTSGTGGRASGTGGRASGTGGRASGTGGRASGTGGRASGTGGRATGTGGRATGTGGRAAGTGGAPDGGIRDAAADMVADRVVDTAAERPVDAIGPDLPPSTPGTLTCGAQTCDTNTQSCCVSIGAGSVGASCVAIGSTCGGAALVCDEPADCASGVCCFGLQTGTNLGSQCVSRAACSGLGRLIVCRTNADCTAPNPACCLTAVGVPICQARCL